MPIHLYAEHLLNIRTLSIQANLSTVSNTETKARLSADGKILTLSHEGESACITLPINLSPKRQSNITLTIPAVPWRELNFRLSLEEREDVAKGTGVLSRDAPVESGNVVPWSATSLSAETEICCKVCGAGIVPRGRVREWRDLPSEGWAEMMDFWHCHKPPEPQGTNGHDHGGLAKGYGIASQIALRSGIGMVDVTEFLLAAEDCRNIRVSNDPTSKSDAARLSCAQCHNPIGNLDPSTGGYKFRKLNLSLSTTKTLPTESFTLEKWLTCQILSASESQGVRKFLVHDRDPSSPSTPSLRIWLFSPDLCVSSSASSRVEFVRMAKVLWREEDAKPQDVEMLSGSAAAAAEGEIRLEGGELGMLRDCLEKSGVLVPEEGRMFMECWRVGLLERFVVEDLGT